MCDFWYNSLRMNKHLKLILWAIALILLIALNVALFLYLGFLTWWVYPIVILEGVIFHTAFAVFYLEDR